MSNAEHHSKPADQKVHNPYAEMATDPETNETELYSTHQLTRILFESFRLSQGSKELQFDFLNFLLVNHLDRFSPDMDLDAVAEKLNTMIIGWMNEKRHTPVGAVAQIVPLQVDSVLTHLDEKYELITELGAAQTYKPNLDDVISRDMRHMHKRPAERAGASFFVHYILQGNTAHVAEIDEYYSACLQGLYEPDSEDETSNNFEDRKNRIRSILRQFVVNGKGDVATFTEDAQSALSVCLGQDWRDQILTYPPSAEDTLQ
jgi:hypothetical protein